MQNRNILIVGANSAVAQAVARRLAASNRLLFLAREPLKLNAFLSEIGQPQAWSACVDFTDIARTRASIQDAWAAAAGLDLVFIAYGLLGEQTFTETDFALAEQVFQVNFNSVVSLLIEVSRRMEQRGSGKIAVISSVAGERGRPRNYSYGAAKAALTRYLEGLRSRLWHSGVEIYTFKMGPVDSPMTVSHHKDFSFSTPDKVARRMLKLLESKRYSAYVPAFWGPVMWVVRWLPEPLFQRLRFLSGR